jgi:hypothetical protein
MIADMDDSAPVQVKTPDIEEHDPPIQGTHPGRQLLLGLGLTVLTVVTAWLFGHLPWVLSGFSWPTTEAAPVGSSSEGLAGVRLTIPLVAAFLPYLIAFTAVGSIAATLLPLVFTTRSGKRLAAVGVVLVSLTLTTVVVTLVARNSIEKHASDAFAGDPRVLQGLVVVVFVTAAVGALLGTLASVQIGFLPLAAAVVAGQAPVWLEAFLVDRSHSADTTRTVDHVSNVVVLVVLLVAFVLSVRRSAAWMVLWPAAIAIVWVATPFRIMTWQLATQLRPSSGLPDSLPGILRAGLDVFRASFWEAHQARWPWLLALAGGVVWLLVERGVRQVRR